MSSFLGFKQGPHGRMGQRMEGWTISRSWDVRDGCSDVLFPWEDSCQGLSAADTIPWFSGSPVQQAVLPLLLCERGWEQSQHIGRDGAASFPSLWVQEGSRC